MNNYREMFYEGEIEPETLLDVIDTLQSTLLEIQEIVSDPSMSLDDLLEIENQINGVLNK